MALLRKFRSGHTDLLPTDTFLSSAKALISVLREVDQYPSLYLNHQVLRKAIHRYEHRWIPMLARMSPQERLALVPPLDVEWVWYCHMLCPVKYITDSTAMLNAVSPNEDVIIDHTFLSEKKRIEGIKRAEKQWRKMFPNEKFHVLERLRDAPVRENPSSLEKAENNVTDNGVGLASRISHDIVAAAERQMAFIYQVAFLPQYGDDKFLEQSAKSYCRMFLKSQRRFRGEVWMPTYDINLMWHVHMMYPVMYKENTEQHDGSILPHGDTLNDSSPGSEPMLRGNVTNMKKKTSFRESLKRPEVICDGRIWRGNVEADEMIARPILKELMKGVETTGVKLSMNEEDGSCMQSYIRYAIPFEVDYGGDVNLENTAPEWVHMTDYRRCNAAMQDADKLGNKIERITFLNHKDEQTVLKCRTLHYVVCNEQGDPDDFRTILEVFSSASNVPIATAHSALPHTLWEYDSKEPSNRQRLPEEMVLVLRVAGEDVALLGGRWASGNPGSTDSLTLRLCLLPGNVFLPLRSLSPRNYGTDRKPGNYSFDLPVFEDGQSVMTRSEFDLSTGRVDAGHASTIVQTYLVSMAAAALHVSLQPRFKPNVWDKISDGSMYPAFSIQQNKYCMIQGGGGEIKSGTGNWGLWAMLFHVDPGSIKWGTQSTFVNSVPGTSEKHGSGVHGRCEDEGGGDEGGGDEGGGDEGWRERTRRSRTRRVRTNRVRVSHGGGVGGGGVGGGGVGGGGGC